MTVIGFERGARYWPREPLLNGAPECFVDDRRVLAGIFLRWVFASLFKSRERLKAENLALRHQITVLRRSAPQRLRLPTQPARVERSIRTPWRARIWAWR